MTTKTKAKLHKTRIDIPEKNRLEIIEMLNHALALGLDLRMQVKFAHWNVKGMNFIALHELFDELAAELAELTDTLAERATTLGGIAEGSLQQVHKNTQLPEMEPKTFNGEEMVTALAERYAQYGKALRNWIDEAEDQDDADTADIFTEVSRAIDLRLWFLEAHIQA